MIDLVLCSLLLLKNMLITMVLYVEKIQSFFTNNDSAYESAISLHKKGIKVEAIIDIREKSNSKIIKEAIDLGIKNLLVSHCSGY